MRIARLLTSLVLSSGIFLLPYFTFAQSVESIPRFEVQISVRADGLIDVEEKITYDFGENERHGIYRDIPKTYTDSAGETRSLAFSAIAVTDDTGESSQIKLSDEGDSYRIRIGDADTTITGVHVYNIQYRVAGAIFYTQDFDEFYWNVTGNEWEVPIEYAYVNVAMPEVAAIMRHACYQGEKGSKDICDKTTYISPTEGGDNTIQFEANKTLPPGSGLTIGIAAPRGVITQVASPERPSMEGVEERKPASLLEIIGGIVLPLLVLLGCLFVWRKIGKDPKEGTVIAQFNAPNDLSVLEMAMVQSPFGNSKAFSAAVVSLAAQGAFSITQIEEKTLAIFTSKDYVLTEVGGKNVLANDIDKDLYGALFADAMYDETTKARSVQVSKINKTAMTVAIQKLQKKVSENMVTKGLYTRNPGTTTGLFILFGVLILIGAGAIIAAFSSIPLIIGLGVSVVIVIVFATLMPQKTQKGAQLNHHLKGLKLYLSVAEKDRLEFHNAPEKTPELFERLLPYAMLFGVVSIWVKEFEGIATHPPSYYHGTGVFSPVIFASDMNSFSSSLAAVAVSSSGSGGGGSSGGGAGGGGGGSW